MYAYDSTMIAGNELNFAQGDRSNSAAHGGDVGTPPKKLIFVAPPDCVGTAVGSPCQLVTTSGAELPSIKVCERKTKAF